MNKTEFNQRLKELYLPPTGEFTILEVPEISYMMIDGTGNPEHESFNNAVKWLYSVVHYIRPLVKKVLGKNMVEPPLECLFWADDAEDFTSGNKDKWRWRVMIVYVPDIISTQDFDDSVLKVKEKLGHMPETFRVRNIKEGNCVQTMHLGDYEKIQSVCHELYHEFLPEHGLQPNGPYHEIYLNDPTRVAKEKRKVVIRQPVKPCT